MLHVVTWPCSWCVGNVPPGPSCEIGPASRRHLATKTSGRTLARPSCHELGGPVLPNRAVVIYYGSPSSGLGAAACPPRFGRSRTASNCSGSAGCASREPALYRPCDHLPGRLHTQF